MKPRIEYIDIGKALLILMLLIDHLYPAALFLGIQSPYFYLIGDVRLLFLPFYMQAFFFLSGYCSNFNKSANEFFTGLFKQTLLPLFIYDIVRFTADGFIYGEPSRIYDFITTGGSFENTTLWFLFALSFSKLVVYFIKSYGEIQMLIVCLLFLVISITLSQFDIGPNTCCLRHSLGSVLFVYIGYLFKRHRELLDYCIKYGFIIYFITFVVFNFIIGWIPIFTWNIHVVLKSLPVFIVLSLSGTFTLIRIAKMINSCKVLSYVGRNTLAIYLMHFLFLQIIMKFLYSFIDLGTLFNTAIFFFITYAIEILLCLLIIPILNSKYLSWTIGKF